MEILGAVLGIAMVVGLLAWLFFNVFERLGV
jgi:hypothetical protein